MGQAEVTLREITADAVRAICALEVAKAPFGGLPGATELLASYVPGEAGPRDFYLRYGFEETGEVEEGEHVIRLGL